MTRNRKCQINAANWSKTRQKNYDSHSIARSSTAKFYHLSVRYFPSKNVTRSFRSRSILNVAWNFLLLCTSAQCSQRTAYTYVRCNGSVSNCSWCWTKFHWLLVFVSRCMLSLSSLIVLIFFLFPTFIRRSFFLLLSFRLKNVLQTMSMCFSHCNFSSLVCPMYPNSIKTSVQKRFKLVWNSNGL